MHSCLSPHVHTHLQVSVWCDKLLDQLFDSVVGETKGFQTFEIKTDNDAPYVISLMVWNSGIPLILHSSLIEPYFCIYSNDIHIQPNQRFFLSCAGSPWINSPAGSRCRRSVSNRSTFPAESSCHNLPCADGLIRSFTGIIWVAGPESRGMCNRLSSCHIVRKGKLSTNISYIWYLLYGELRF